MHNWMWFLCLNTINKKKLPGCYVSKTIWGSFKSCMVHYAWSCLILGWRALSSMTWSRNQQQFSLRLSEATRVSAWTRSRLLLPQQDGADHNIDARMLELHWTVNTHTNTNVLKKNVLNLQVEWLFWYSVCSDYRLQMRARAHAHEFSLTWEKGGAVHMWAGLCETGVCLAWNRRLRSACTWQKRRICLDKKKKYTLFFIF